MDSQNLQTFQLNIKKDLSIFELNIQESLPAHQMVAILGASGSGKTSLLHCMAGIASFQGTWGKANERGKPTVGIVFQNYELFPHLSVYENIRYGLRWQKMSEDERSTKIEFWAKELRLEHLLNRMPLHLSGGEKQRVALAQALVLSPDVLLLDEPTSSLDTNLKSKFLESLKALQTKWNLSVFWVTHDFREVLSFADHALLLDQGKMTQSGAPIELYEKPRNLWAGEFTGELNSLGNRQYLRPHHLQVSGEAGKNPAKLLSLQNKGMYFMGLFETMDNLKLWGFLSRALNVGETYYLSWREDDILTFSE